MNKTYEQSTYQVLSNWPPGSSFERHIMYSPISLRREVSNGRALIKQTDIQLQGAALVAEIANLVEQNTDLVRKRTAEFVEILK